MVEAACGSRLRREILRAEGALNDEGMLVAAERLPRHIRLAHARHNLEPSSHFLDTVSHHGWYYDQAALALAIRVNASRMLSSLVA